MNKLLISLIIFNLALFSTSALGQESEVISYDEGIIKNVLVTLFFYPNKEALHAAVCAAMDGDEYACSGGFVGFSACERKPEKNIAYCDIWQLAPSKVDGDNTLTLGHELMHGVAGPNYHSD